MADAIDVEDGLAVGAAGERSAVMTARGAGGATEVTGVAGFGAVLHPVTTALAAAAGSDGLAVGAAGERAAVITKVAASGAAEIAAIAQLGAIADAVTAAA